MYEVKDNIIFESLVNEKDWNIFIGKKIKAKIDDKNETQYKIVFNDKHFAWFNIEKFSNNGGLV